jgi:hypothetical protein
MAVSEEHEQAVQRWLDDVAPLEEIAVVAALRELGRPVTVALLTRHLGLHQWAYPSVMWAAEKLARRGLAKVWYPGRGGPSGGGSRRLVELLA